MGGERHCRIGQVNINEPTFAPESRLGVHGLGYVSFVHLETVLFCFTAEQLDTDASTLRTLRSVTS